MVIVDRHIAPPASFDVELDVGHQRNLVARVKPVWVSQTSATTIVGCEFISMDRANRDILRRFLLTLLEPSSFLRLSKEAILSFPILLVLLIAGVLLALVAWSYYLLPLLTDTVERPIWFELLGLVLIFAALIPMANLISTLVVRLFAPEDWVDDLLFSTLGGDDPFLLEKLRKHEELYGTTIPAVTEDEKRYRRVIVYYRLIKIATFLISAFFIAATLGLIVTHAD